MILLLAAALASIDADNGRVARELRAVPRPVREFVQRRADCNYASGEYGDDAARNRDLDRFVRKLRCDRIDADERRIRRTYAKSSQVRWLLSATRDWTSLE